MILFKENGRFGNQIFQYCGLRTLVGPGETLCLIGFEDLQSVFDGIDAEIINHHAKKYKRSFYYRMYSYAEKLAEKNLIPVLTENEERDIIKSSASFNKVKIAKNIFLQSESYFHSEIVDQLSIKKKFIDDANELLNSITDPSHVPIFVHVRRGDYLKWPSSKFPAVLPKNYYINSIKEVEKKIERPFFIFTSDEPEYATKEFSEIEPKYISRQSLAIDFAIMTKCKGGILSPSSFSWWAAWFLKKQNKLKPLLIAPKFWIGHRLNQWYPNKIEASFLSYRSIDAF